MLNGLHPCSQHQAADAAWDVDAVVLTMISMPGAAVPTKLVDANRLWRARSPVALAAYLTLLVQNPRPIYARNAVMCARAVSTSMLGGPQAAERSQTW